MIAPTIVLPATGFPLSTTCTWITACWLTSTVFGYSDESGLVRVAVIPSSPATVIVTFLVNFLVPTVEVTVITALPGATAFTVPLLLTVATVLSELEKATLAFERRDVLIEEYERESNKFKLEQAEPKIKELNDTYLKEYGKGKIDELAIEEEFETVFENILPEYFVFKGDWDLKNFDHYDMMKYLSIYKTISKTEPYSAAQIVRDDLKAFIDKEQGLFTHFCYGDGDYYR